MNDSDPVTRHIRHQLDRQAVDAETRRRLRQARSQALSALDRPQHGWFASPAARAGLALAGIAGLALLLMLGISRQNQEPLPDAGLDAFEIATSEAPLEFYQELEFYLWLEQQELG